MAKSPFSSLKPEILSDIAEQASKLLPGEKSREEIQRSIQLMVQSALSRLDLVTREEFDAQTAVLQKTRAKIDALELEMAELNKKLSKKISP